MTAITIALIGNPNAGKTTLFNTLTGSKQSVGNWPGVTVERKEGLFEYQDCTITVIDLPGIYSLTSVSGKTAVDEKIACEFILSHQADIIVNVVDASNLERNLYLTTQLLAMPIPVIIVLNMVDIARQQHMQIDIKQLSKKLGCPIVPVISNKKYGIGDLKKQLLQTVHHPAILAASPIAYPPLIQNAVDTLKASINGISSYLAMALLENDEYATAFMAKQTFNEQVKGLQANIARTGEEADILIADARYGFIHQLCAATVQKPHNATHRLTYFIDKIVLNRLLGIPIFFLIMYLMFAFAINIGSAFQDFFDIATDTVFVQGTHHLLSQLNVPEWLTTILANGIGKGINTVATFIPIIGAMFLFLSLLEHSGYMARAAFVMDRLMRFIGLPGKSFVPMLIGFGCNVPAIMSTRTLESQHDRILTTLMLPFMSCGARLTIFAVFSSAFFAKTSTNIVFMLYVTGIAVALATGFILRNTLLSGKPEPFIMELPLYHRPSFKIIGLQTWSRLKNFIINAGKIIIPVCALIGFLNNITLAGRMASVEHSLLATIGTWLTPVFAPLGLHLDNWPATVALLTGTLAKEVVIGTLNTLYSQMGHLTVMTPTDFSFWKGLYSALNSIPENLKALPDAFKNPLIATAKQQALSKTAFGLMQQHFDGKAGAFAYLLFVLLYIPCISTIAVITRELNRQWAIFSVCWSTGLAYGVATVFYQLSTFHRHPLFSILWTILTLTTFGVTVFLLRFYAKKPILT